MYKSQNWTLLEIAFRVKVYAEKRGITTDQALEELREKLEVKNE